MTHLASPVMSGSCEIILLEVSGDMRAVLILRDGWKFLGLGVRDGWLGCGGFEALLECSFMKAQSHIHSI